MKIYSNDPQDWTVEDACIEEFDDKSWESLYESMRCYFEFNQYALDSFKEWWVEQRIKEIENEPKDYDY
jgi:hypothetical protein